MKKFLEIININSSNSLLTSFYYISKIAGYFKYLDDPKFFVQKKNIDEFRRKNDISLLPFLLKLPKIFLKSNGSELLEGHTLPIVGLYQMKNGLLLSGSCGLLKVWKKIDDINDENYNKFKIFRTVSYNHDLIRNFIELENDIVIFCKGQQLIEAIINDKDEYKEIFTYNATGSCLESLVALNNNKNVAA